MRRARSSAAPSRRRWPRRRAAGRVRRQTRGAGTSAGPRWLPRRSPPISTSTSSPPRARGRGRPQAAGPAVGEHVSVSMATRATPGSARAAGLPRETSAGCRPRPGARPWLWPRALAARPSGRRRWAPRAERQAGGADPDRARQASPASRSRRGRLGLGIADTRDPTRGGDSASAARRPDRSASATSARRPGGRSMSRVGRR